MLICVSLLLKVKSETQVWHRANGLSGFLQKETGESDNIAIFMSTVNQSIRCLRGGRLDGRQKIHPTDTDWLQPGQTQKSCLSLVYCSLILFTSCTIDEVIKKHWYNTEVALTTHLSNNFDAGWVGEMAAQMCRGSTVTSENGRTKGVGLRLKFGHPSFST